ncbi:MAG TPA: FG-GAP-like repeat-containing protein [Pyrinomonadaceae bacterium]|jgi:uncharacterized delta-60 repeat protein
MFRYFVKNTRKFRSTTRFFLAAMLPIMQIISAGNAAQAQQNPGSLDPTFNGSGKIVTDLGNPDNIAGAVAVQPDGKIVIAGLTGAIESESATPGSSDFVVLRYNSDGTLDNTFDGDGRVATSFGNGEEGASEVLVQPDGKILVAGSVNARTSAGEIALARYNSNGSLDATFDGDGKTTTDAQQNIDERASAMVLQPDGKIVVAVSTVRENSLEEQIYVVRFNANGSHDFSFAGDGVTTLPPVVIPGGVQQGLSVSDAALQADGKIVVAGTVSTAQNSDFFVWRINPDGTGDQTFGGRVVTASFGISDNAVSVFVLPNNKILVAGSTFTLPNLRNDFAFARFNTDGTLDAAFDGDGKKTTSYNDAAFSISFDFEMLPNGKIVSAGTIITGEPEMDSSFAVTRFDAEGNLDATFDNDGKALTNFGAGLDVAFAVAIQRDGKIIAAGSTETNSRADNYNFAVARYIGDGGNAPRKTEFDFDGDGKSDISVFRPTEQAYWYYLRSGSNDAFAGVQWGTANDRIAPADYDGDGKTDIAVWRSNANNQNQSYFYILNSSNNTFRAEQFGNNSDIPWSGDWDGDGRADLAVYRRAANANEQSHFYYRPSSAAGVNFVTIDWGKSTDEPMRGDFDGDGKLDAAVARGNVWYIRQSSNGAIRTENWGVFTDRWVPADYDGDGKTDVAIYRDGAWYIKQSSNNQPRYVSWGLNTDRPVPADYDGDGKADVAVYRRGTWYLLNSSNGGMKSVNFGLPNDMLIPTAYLRVPIIF